jgi:flagellar motor switch protein FliN
VSPAETRGAPATAAELLTPHLEAATAAAAAALPFAAVTAGNVVAVDDPGPALPLGGVRLLRATVGGVGLDIVIALTDAAVDQACEAAGTDNPITAVLPIVTAAIEAIGERSGLSLPMTDLEEMGVGAPWGAAGFEAATAGLFDGDDQLGNVIFLFSPVDIAAEGGTVDIAVASFPDTEADAGADRSEPLNPLSMLRGVEMRVTAELGRTRLPVSHLLDLGPGSVVELDRVAGTPVDVVVNGTTIARGEVVVIDEEYGVRITEIVGAEDAR